VKPFVPIAPIATGALAFVVDSDAPATLDLLAGQIQAITASIEADVMGWKRLTADAKPVFE
jgi:hypothetical protein